VTINEYLERSKKLHIKAERAEERYQELLAAATSPGSSLNTERFPGTHDVHKREKILTALAQQREDWVIAEYDYMLCRADLFDQINKITNDNVSEVMYQRYVREMTVERLCDAMAMHNHGKPMSRTCVFRTIKKGKAQLAQILRDQGVEIEDN